MTAPSFKGGQLDTFSSKGKFQVSFKGRPPVDILANIAEGRRPEALREFSHRFARKIRGHFASEERFDRSVINCIWDRINNRLCSDSIQEIANFNCSRSSMTADKYNSNVLPNKDEIERYVKTHPVHKDEYRSIMSTRIGAKVTGGGAGIGLMICALTAPATAGLSFFAAPLLTAGTAWGGAMIAKDQTYKQVDRLINKIDPEFRAFCANYKLKRLIAKGKINVPEVLNILKKYK